MRAYRAALLRFDDEGRPVYDADGLLVIGPGPEGLRLAGLVRAAGLAPSNSEAMRKIKERAVRVAGDVVEDPQAAFHAGFEGLVQVGKRSFAKVRLVASAG